MSRASLIRELSKLVKLHNELVKLSILLLNINKDIDYCEKDKNIPYVPLHLLDFAASVNISEKKMYELDPTNGYIIEKTGNIEDKINELKNKIKETNEMKPKIFQNKKSFEEDKNKLLDIYNKQLINETYKLDNIRKSNKDKEAEHNRKAEDFNRIKSVHRMNLIRHKINTTQAIYQLEVLYNERGKIEEKIKETRDKIRLVEESLNNQEELLDKYNNIVQLTKLLEFLEAESADTLKEAYFIFEINSCWYKIDTIDTDKLDEIKKMRQNLLYKNMLNTLIDAGEQSRSIESKSRDNVMKNTSLADIEIVQYWNNEEIKTKLSDTEIEKYKNHIWLK